VVPWGDLTHDSERNATIVVQEVVAEGSHTTFRNLFENKKKVISHRKKISSDGLSVLPE